MNIHEDRGRIECLAVQLCDGDGDGVLLRCLELTVVLNYVLRHRSSMD